MPSAGEVDQSYPNRLKAFGLSLLEPFKGAKIHHMLQCDTCSHQWSATPISKIQSNKKYGHNGCPVCNTSRKDGVKADKRQLAIDSITSKGFDILSDYDGQQTTTSKIVVRNTKCGHEFETAPGNLLHRDVECPVCNDNRKRNQFKTWGKEKQALYLTTASEWQKYKSAVYSLTRQAYATHQNVINPLKLPTGRAGTKGAYHLDHIVAVRYCFNHNIPAHICAHPQNLRMVKWEANLAKKHKLEPHTIPPLFHQYVDSKTVETGFAEYVVNCMDKPTEIFSTILNPYVATIWVPSANVAIVFCTISQYLEQKTNNRHIITDMIAVAQQTGIRLVVVYEDEWFFNKELVVSKIQHICGCSNVPSLYARKCIVKPVLDSKQKAKFLNAHHIQGNDKAQISIGAFYDNELVAIMTFAKPRILMGGKQETGTWELSRFATDTSRRVVGIAGKLLTYFKHNYSWSKIYSYADRRWSYGNVYQKLGFAETVVNPPEYYYIKDGVRMHRWAYRKDVLKTMLENYDPQLTEYQNMLNHGYDRVWGAGTIRYEITKVD